MDIETMAKAGKEWFFVFVSNSEHDTLTGKVSESEYGDEFFHLEGTGDDEDIELEVRQSSIVCFYELEEEDSDEEPEEEEKPVRKDKYENRSVDDVPKKKKTGWFG
jgi:hypothetical protein